MLETTWTEEQVRELLKDGSYDYQRIDLPYGLSTGGVDRSATAARIFEDDLTGKSVLDLGCRYGYFCFEAVKRGAERVVGVDVAPECIEGARKLADCLGAKASFEVMDIEKGRIDGSFDYVLALNLLHHLRNPLATLEKLIAATRERLVLEVAALGSHDRKKLHLPIGSGWFLNRAPAIVLNETRQARKIGRQKFFFTARALDTFLCDQRRTFSRFDVFPSEHKGGRFIGVAHKRRIGRMIVVSGPSSAGKSTLIERLQANEQPEVAERLDVGDGSTWETVGGSKLRTLSEPAVPKLLFHYDFLNPYMRSEQVHSRDPALDVLDNADDVTFLTIWTPPERLHAQLVKGEIQRQTRFGIYMGRKRHLKLEKEYQVPAKVIAHYRAWFEFTRTRPGKHLVVCFDDGVRFYSVEEWEKLVEPYER